MAELHQQPPSKKAKVSGSAEVRTTLTTTVIGSFPKPHYLKIPDWFKLGTCSGNETVAYSAALGGQSAEEKAALEADVLRASEEVVRAQVEAGIHIVTDGEVRRENYIHYLCRFIEGVDFERLAEVPVRDGAYVAKLPTIQGKVRWCGPLDCAAEWRKAQDLCPAAHMKYTLPGPMTIMGTTHNVHYKDERDLAADLAAIVNHHVRELARAGCKHIQVDEPLFARQPQKALAWGFEMLERCFEGVGVGDGVERQVHMCCGYPGYLDQTDYMKADPQAYFQLADKIDESCIDALSIEDAHRHNNLALLGRFKRTKVILGVVQVAASRVETVEEIEVRLRAALKHIDADRLVVAPDCGLGLLPAPVLRRKLANMCTAARLCLCRPPAGH